MRTFGGFAPALRPPPREVDASRLDAPAAKRLEHLVSALPRSVQSVAPPPHERRPDERHYEICIVDAHGERTVKFADSTMTSAYEALVAFIQEHG